MTHIKNTYLGNIYILNFTKSIEKYSAASISSLYNIKDEISKLKPYLNRTGRNMVESLMKKYFRDENQQLTLDDIVYYKNEIREIQKAFPSLSHREVILCGLLINNMETKDIASITNRTIDSVFVTIHRINKKLNLTNKKDLIETLKEIVLKKSSMQMFEEFDS
jgi:DNA-binding CsgD family transcriptional regulator